MSKFSGQGAMGGAMSGASAGAMFGPWGAAIGGVAGGLMGGFMGPEEAEAPEMDSPEDMAIRGINLRRYELLPRYLETRRDFDQKMLDTNFRQQREAFGKQRSLFENDINPSLFRQNRAFLNQDVQNFNELLANQGGSFRKGLLSLSPELANAQQGIDEDTRLLSELRRQAQQDLESQGRLSSQDMRDLEQQTSSYTGRMGRGAGAFNVGQLAVNRDKEINRRKAEQRGFASGVYGLGAEQQRRNLLQSEQFTSPFLNMLSQSQGRAFQFAGTPAQQYGLASQFAQYSTPDVPQGYDPHVLQLESLRLGQGLGQAQIRQDANTQRFDAQMGLLGGGLSAMGQMYGNQNISQPGINYSNPTQSGYLQYGSGNVASGNPYSSSPINF